MDELNGFNTNLTANIFRFVERSQGSYIKVEDTYFVSKRMRIEL